MKSKLGVILIAIVAASALSVVLAASASANWFIEGKELGAGKSAALATSAVVDEQSTLSVFPEKSSKIKIKCSGSTLNGNEPYISGGATAMAKSLTFTGCSVTEPTTGCELEGQPTNISTNPLGATVLLIATKGVTKVSITFTPLTKKTFTTVEFAASNKCAFNAEEPINGALLVLSSDGFEEKAVHLIDAQGSVENNSLEVAGAKAFLEGGKALLKLASGSKWSFV